MIHSFNKGKEHFVVDVNSGAVHVVDDLACKIIKHYEGAGNFDLPEEIWTEFDRELVLEAIEEIQSLIDEKELFSEDPRKSIFPTAPSQHIVKALCLHVAHDCNLKCRYCFAAQGNFEGTKCLMSVEVAKAALDFLVANSGSRKTLECDLFGGEPLMNWKVIEWIVDYRYKLQRESGKKIRLTITTNGTLLNDERIDYINKHFYNCVLSLDGRKSVNDYMRPKLNDIGSYDTIVPKFKKLVDNRGKNTALDRRSYYLRGTYTSKNLDFDKDVLHMADLGFSEISVEPVVADKGEPYALKEEDLPEIFESYDRLADAMIDRKKNGKDFNFFHYVIDLKNGPCLLKRISGCGAGSEYFAITPEGDVYPCHQFVGDEDFILGNVLEGLDKVPFRADFFNSNVTTKEDCQSCWAKYYCSGGCHANAYNQNGDIKKPYRIACELQKKRIENSIFLTYKLAECE